MDTHTWVHHPETDGYWQCPAAALDEMKALGWEPCEAPPEPNPAVAERVAFLAELAAAERAAAGEAETKPTTKPRRGESE